MNCKYCGAGLPTKGGVCPNCGKMIPMDQLREIKQMTDPNWNNYMNKDTSFYKRESAYEDNSGNKKFVLLIAGLVIILIIILIIKGMS